MRIDQSFFWHGAGLLGFLMLSLLLWMIPVSLMGFPLEFPAVEPAQYFVESGLVPSGDGRLRAVLFAFFAQSIAWNDLWMWSLLSCSIFAATLLVWWILIRRLFDVRVAWVSIVLFAFMPVYWREATLLTTYCASFLVLFLSFLAFDLLRERNRYAAMAVSGLLFGVCIGFKDVFLLFLPWMVLSVLWMHRTQLKSVFLEVLVFLLCVFAIYTAPLVPGALSSDAPFVERVQSLLPVQRTTPPIEEFYGDLYTYEFDREWFEQKSLEMGESAETAIERMRNEHRRISFNVGDGGLLRSIFSGAWLFLHHVLDLVFVETIGGIVLWVFILSGIVALYRERRSLLVLSLGLVLSVEVLVRFVLHFQRIHFMNYGWVFALLAAVGVCSIVNNCLQKSKRNAIALSFCTACITVLLAAHLLQMNRVVLARQYLKSAVPEQLQAVEAINVLPADAVVAAPTYQGLGLLSDRDLLFLREDSVVRMLEQGRAAEAVSHYGITHVLGYPSDLANGLREAVPRVQIVQPVDSPTQPVSLALEYLLHLVR